MSYPKFDDDIARAQIFNDHISEQEIERGDGWRVIEQTYWVDEWSTEVRVVLEAEPFATSRQLVAAIPVLRKWRDDVRDQHGPTGEGPAMRQLIDEWHRYGLDQKRFKHISDALNKRIQDLYRNHPEAAEKWLDELGLSNFDRSMKGEWLTPEKARQIFRRWQYQWRNIPPTGPAKT